MKFFTKSELKIIFSILFFISFISFFNFKVSIRRARDAQRKNDLGTLQESLDKFQKVMGIYPLSSEDGRIISCKGEDTYFDEVNKAWVNLRACDWGKDNLFDYSSEDGTIFMKPIPNDPKNLEGTSFRYESNGRRFQLFVALEGEDEAEFNLPIFERNISCGNKICNYGRSSGSTPLDKSIAEYENELLERQLKQ